MKTQPYICKIHIENFRNFHFVDFTLKEKQVLIGENAVGKSNLLYALQLILDPTLSENERMLEESDFWDGLANPMESGEQILIQIYFKNYEDNKDLLAQLCDASVRLDQQEEALKITYKFYKKDPAKSDYTYIIYKGDNESNPFTFEDRKMLNLRLIKAIRDVEAEMKNSRTSPLAKIIKQKYTISKDVLSDISKKLEEEDAASLHIGQVNDLETRLQNLMNDIVAYGDDNFNISLRTMNVDATKLLYALRPLINKRETSNTSLGVNNILYVALILLLIEDDTIKSFIPGNKYRDLLEKDSDHILEDSYTKSDKADEYIINLEFIENPEIHDKLYAFFSDNVPASNGVTILAVEEPESHLHPIYQRLLYRHIMNKTNASVLITTHSTHISSVAPINSLVHLISTEQGTQVHTTASLALDVEDREDLARYIDVKRGELYMAKGIVFVEGIAEEYLIPSFALALGYDLDRLGIIVCNINSTNFKPYCQFATALGIPYVVITDGDYYHKITKQENGKIKFEKRFGDMASDSDTGIGYDGIDRMYKVHETAIAFSKNGYNSFDFQQKRQFFTEYSEYIGEYTLETDIFTQANKKDKETICNLFNELTSGSSLQKTKFKEELESGKYDKCLAKIESSYSNIGKGRFAQRLSGSVTSSMIPQYISNAITAIIDKVR